MTSKDIARIVKYWVDAAVHDFDTARSLFRTGKYDYCLFLCHLSLEKLLKALATRALKDHPPFTHNLLYLAGKADIPLTKTQIEALDQINRFNMEARYPEDLRAFYKKVNRPYAKKYFDVTKELWKWLRKKLEA